MILSKGARANNSIPKRGSMSPRQDQPTTQRMLDLQTDIAKLEAQVQSNGTAEPEWNKLARSFIDIAKADIAAGNTSFLGTMPAHQAGAHIAKALLQMQETKTVAAVAAPGDALRVAREARETIGKAEVWFRVHRTMVEAGAASRAAQEEAEGGGQE